MRQTELLREIRLMRFEEAYGGWTESRLTHQAGCIPGPGTAKPC